MIKVDMYLDDAIDYCKMQSLFHQNQLSSLRKEKADPTLIYSEMLQIRQMEIITKYLRELAEIKEKEEEEENDETYSIPISSGYVPDLSKRYGNNSVCKTIDDQKLLSKIDEAIEATNSDDTYSRGMRNGMRYIKSLIDGEEPEYEVCSGEVSDDEEIQAIIDAINFYEHKAEETRDQKLNLAPFSFEKEAELLRELKRYKETIPNSILDKLTSYDEQLKELDKNVSDLETIINEKAKSKEESHKGISTPNDVLDDAMKELRDLRGDDTSLPFEVAQALDMGITALLEWKRFEKAIELIKEEAADMNGPSNVEITPLTVEALDRLANHYLEKVRKGEWET